MKNIRYSMVLFVLLAKSGYSQAPPKKELYNKEFNWKITIPENFENVSVVDWAKLQNRGKEAIEKTYDAEMVDHTTTIFVFRADQFNYFEANCQPFDISIDGDYLESFKEVNQVLFNTFKAQIPNVVLDSLSSDEIVDGFKFNKFKVIVNFPNKVIMDFTMYSRLFNKKEFTVNIMTVDKEKRKMLFDAWRNSNFGRK